MDFHAALVYIGFSSCNYNPIIFLAPTICECKAGGRVVRPCASHIFRCRTKCTPFSVLCRSASVFATGNVFYRRTCQRNTYDLLARILYYVLAFSICVSPFLFLFLALSHPCESTRRKSFPAQKRLRRSRSSKCRSLLVIRK